MKKETWLSVEEYEVFTKIIHRIANDFYRFSISKDVYDIPELEETNYSDLSAKDVIDKIKEFFNSSSTDIGKIIFLNLLSRYPVSMCKRQITPLMGKIIGFTYHAGQQVEKIEKKQWGEIDKISMEEVAEWFVRSKATVHVYVTETESEWKEILQEAEKGELKEKAKDVAFKELVEEEKERLRLEREKQRNNQTIRTNTPKPSEEDICQ